MDLVQITFVLAGATVVLALATGWMAYQTRQMAKATGRMASATQDSVGVSRDHHRTARKQLSASREQVEVSQRQAEAASETLRLTIQPLLVDVPAGVFLGEFQVRFTSHATIRIQDGADVLRDLGSKSFVSCSVPLRNVGNGVAVVSSAGVAYGAEARWPVRLSQTLVPPGELVRVTASVPVDRPELEPLREGIRQGLWQVEVGYANIEGSARLVTTLDIFGSRVRQVSFRRADEGKPFLTSGPADG